MKFTAMNASSNVASGLRAALIALFLTASAASAQKLPEGMTMHRVQAGEPDASGWTMAASTHGGFSVRLPMKFNDFTMEGPGGSKIAKHFIVGAKDAKGLKIMAMKILYREKGAHKHFFARIESGKALPRATVKKHEFQGRRAADVSMRSPRAFAYFRYVLLADGMVVLSVEVPRGPLTIPPMAKVRKFFASLQISGPPKARSPN